ncbi:MAG TPA: hypothetical protein VFE58_13990 [Tepidisphaeraceae bacterium]|jgi:hypothetical protein|nr:hypothetical protein [Tepidisphaeraceae bacterium]
MRQTEIGRKWFLRSLLATALLLFATFVFQGTRDYLGYTSSGQASSLNAVPHFPGGLPEIKLEQPKVSYRSMISRTGTLGAIAGQASPQSIQTFLTTANAEPAITDDNPELLTSILHNLEASTPEFSTIYSTPIQGSRLPHKSNIVFIWYSPQTHRFILTFQHDTPDPRNK